MNGSRRLGIMSSMSAALAVAALTSIGEGYSAPIEGDGQRRAKERLGDRPAEPEVPQKPESRQVRRARERAAFKCLPARSR